jgi:aspartyl-tRNA(Asn)/glutamyl-tRNA(Gln) amidotransferase subunit C
MIPTGNKPSDQIDVRYVAHLARMHLADGEVARLQPQLEQIVGYVRQLNELNVEGIEPTAHAIPVQNVFRADEVRPCLDHDAAMKNAPLAREGQFIVPKIIE